MALLKRKIANITQESGLDNFAPPGVDDSDPRVRGDSRACSVLYLVSCVLFYVLFFVSSSVCYTLAASHLPPLQAGSTFLLITDLSGLGPTVEVSFYDDTGREVSTFHKLLPPDGKIQIKVEDYLRAAGSIVLESSNERIVGEYWQINKDRTMFMLPLQSPGEEGRYFVNCSWFPPCERNYIVLSDPYGTGPVVQMEFYSRMGELVKITRKLLRPYGTLVFEVSNSTSGDALGKVSVRSFGGSVVLHYRQLCRNAEAQFSEPVTLAVPVYAPAKNLFVNEFSTGRRITGNLTIADASAKGPVVRVQFLDFNGEVLANLEKLLPPNGIVNIDPADYVSNVENGIIKISSDSEIIANYWEQNPQTIVNIPAIPDILYKTSEILSISYFLPAAVSKSNTQVSLSLLSVVQKTIEVELQFYNSEGKKIDSKEILLEPYERIRESVDHYFNQSRFGTIVVKGASLAVVLTSHVFDLKSGQSLGRAYAISR